MKIKLWFIILFILLFISFGLNIYFFKGGHDISKWNINAAEKLLELNFSSQETSLMLADLKENLHDYKSIRQITLENSVAPSILFNPAIPGMKLENPKDFFTISDCPNIEVPLNLEYLAFYPIPVLAQLIRTGHITSTALTKMYLDRLKKYGPRLECVITLTEELALKQAQRADAEIAAGHYKGLLHGIPYGIKDLFSTKGYKTTWGATPYKDQIFDKDATVVKKLEEAGAVLVAKLSMGALAWGDVWFDGKTRNPWNIEQGSSGSSAGSASAVSAGLVPFAIGTETWGSIVSPCTVCGVTGLRPTFGRVSRTGAMALSWSMDKIGPICRNAEDCAIVFNAIHGPDGFDLTVQNIPFNFCPDIDLTALKIGYLKEDFDSDYKFKKTDSLTLVMLKKMGVNLIPLKLPELPVKNISFILSAEAAAAFDELTRSGKDDLLVRQIKNAWPNVFRASRFIPAVEYVNANRIRTLLIHETEKMIKDIDLYIAPSWQGNNLLLTNLTGHPCIVVPNGFSEEGTPTSICIIGKLYDEGKIIAVAKAFQDATDFHLKHPEL
jgi:Asp-tRNA(Asn)/Glu-tRNA(Gln) amidotransferase A subunit family amidase